MFTKRAKTENLSKEQEAKVNEKFNSFAKGEYSEDDVHKVLDNEENIMNKMTDKNLVSFIDDVKVFFSMLGDFFTKKYTQVPIGTVIAIAGTLLYVLSPINVVPDFIPVLGYIDDAAVLGLCLNFVKVDVDAYKEFKGKKR